MRRHESDHEVPWAMPLVVLRDKSALASETDVCELAAGAVVRLLDDPRAAPGGPWHEAVEYWRDGAIRKVVRRADGKRWSDVQELPGITLERAGVGESGTAEVRAFVPGPVSPLPRALAKLQVGGTDFPHGEASATTAPVVISISPHVTITSGKAAAQCAHGAQLAYEELVATGDGFLGTWREAGFPMRLERPSADAWDALDHRVQVFDAGFTELEGVTETVRVVW